jgi:UDP-N-acetylmuramoylalanine--D-glutamate ligase
MPAGTDFKNKRIAVAGFGAEGRSAAEFLVSAGAQVEVFDVKPEEEFPADKVAALRQLGVVFHFGGLGPFTGRDAVLRSPGIPPHAPELAPAAQAGPPLISATTIFFDLCPCPIVGVTGTKGKGTTASLIHQILLAAGRDSYLCGNIGAPALDILKKLSSDSVVVYELSSFQLLELRKSPALAVVLMITSEHRDFHRTDEEYVSAKANIVKFQRRGDRAIANIDHPASRSLAALAPGEVFEVSRRKKVTQGAYVEAGGVFLATGGGPARKAIDASEVPLAGAHNLENVAAAVLAGALLGVSDEDMVRAVRAFKPLPHRLELVREVGGVRYYDDSISTTPDSAIAALQAFSAPKILILGGSSKGAGWNELAQALAAPGANVKAVIGMGAEWDRIKNALGDKVEGGRFPFRIIEGLKNMPAIVRAAAAAAEPSDVVVLSPACASFDMFRDYKDRGEQFQASVRELP